MSLGEVDLSVFYTVDEWADYNAAMDDVALSTVSDSTPVVDDYSSLSSDISHTQAMMSAESSAWVQKELQTDLQSIVKRLDQTISIDNGYVQSNQSSDFINTLVSLVEKLGPVAIAWRKAGQPTPIMPATNINGSIVTGNDDGTITTIDTRGTSRRGIPPAGQPYMTASGNLITNNGDGTYTRININGTSTVLKYPVSSTGSSSSAGADLFGSLDPKILLVGAGLLIAALR